jgi:hypothetical protein
MSKATEGLRWKVLIREVTEGTREASWVGVVMALRSSVNWNRMA